MISTTVWNGEHPPSKARKNSHTSSKQLNRSESTATASSVVFISHAKLTSCKGSQEHWRITWMSKGKDKGRELKGKKGRGKNGTKGTSPRLCHHSCKSSKKQKSKPTWQSKVYDPALPPSHLSCKQHSAAGSRHAKTGVQHVCHTGQISHRKCITPVHLVLHTPLFRVQQTNLFSCLSFQRGVFLSCFFSLPFP